ncbi:MAG TPA: hypothetical protein VLD35_10505 [Caldimonas sp.]|nr:hypothetical protein [Caldimonas sp.]
MNHRRWTFRGRTLFALGAATLSWGCTHAPVAKYVAPAGARAQLVMRGEVQSGEAYGVYLFDDAAQCTGLRQVGLGATNRNPETTAIATGLQTAEVLIVKANRSACRIRWSFEPSAGRKYVVTAATTPSGCRAQILDATDPHKIVLEPTSRRRDVGGRTCAPLAQTTRLGDAVARMSAAAVGEADLPIGLAPSAPQSPGVSVPAVSDDDLSQLQRK